MFIQYNDLIDDNKLPPKAFYTEPRDLETIMVEPKESLEHFIERVSKYRESKGYPELLPDEMRLLVVSSLERSVTKADIRVYFAPKAALPQYSQVAQLVRTITSQIGRRTVSFNVRQDRADICLGCSLHKPHNNIAQFATNTIQKVVGLVSDSSDKESLAELQFSEKEQKLGACGMCGCKLTSKIRVDTLAALSSIRPDQLDSLLRIYGKAAFDSCWILKEPLGNRELRKILDSKLAKTKDRLGVHLLNDNLKDKHLSAMRIKKD